MSKKFANHIFTKNHGTIYFKDSEARDLIDALNQDLSREVDKYNLLHVTTDNRLTALENNSGGSAKLYHHSILFATNIEYDENGFPSTYEDVTGLISVYRTNNTPITSLSQLTKGEIESGKIVALSLNEAGDQSVPTQNIDAFPNVSQPSINVYYYTGMIESGEGMSCASNWITKFYSDLIIREDTVTEV